MKETASLLSKTGAPWGGEQTMPFDEKRQPGTHPIRVVATTATVVLMAFLVVSVSSVKRSPVPETVNQIGSKAEAVVDSTWRLSQDQRIEMYDGWQLLFSLRGLWNQTQQKLGDKNLTWDAAKLENHSYLWANQMETQGKEWWDDAQQWFQNISEQFFMTHQELTNPVLEEDKINIHKHQSEKHHHRGHSLVFMNHSGAFALLADHDAKNPLEYSSDYFLLNQGLDAQINQAYCAVATSMALLNSLRGIIDLPRDPIYDPYPYATQSDAFNDCTDASVIQHTDTFKGILSSPFGLNLDSAKGLLECHLNPSEWNVEAHHVDPATDSLNSVTVTMVEAILNPKARLMINYHRAAVGQVGGGHFSPVGAYSSSLNAFLVMDVAKYKYPSVWIPAKVLFHSLATIDVCGIWDGPAAQVQLPDELLHPNSADALKTAMAALNCEAAPRGFIVVSPKE